MPRCKKKSTPLRAPPARDRAAAADFCRSTESCTAVGTASGAGRGVENKKEETHLFVGGELLCARGEAAPSRVRVLRCATGRRVSRLAGTARGATPANLAATRARTSFPRERAGHKNCRRCRRTGVSGACAPAAVKQSKNAVAFVAQGLGASGKYSGRRSSCSCGAMGRRVRAASSRSATKTSPKGADALVDAGFTAVAKDSFSASCTYTTY